MTEIRLLVDVNLSPLWCDYLQAQGWDARHWTEVGDPRAPDVEIMHWAREHEWVVLTHDLDFGTILALSHANGPSVVQVRVQDTLPSSTGAIVADALRQTATALKAVALVVVDAQHMRARLLPLAGPRSSS